MRLITRLSLAILLVSQSSLASALWNPMEALGDLKKPNIKIGLLEIHPYYGLTLTYDDNIYKVGRDKIDGSRTSCLPGNAAACSGGWRGSLTTVNNVGSNFKLAVGETHTFNAGYDFTSSKYATQSTANDAISQTASGSYNFKGAAVNAALFDNFTNTQDPAFNPNKTTLGGELVERQRRWQNTVGAALEYSLGERFFVGLDGQNTVHKYLDRTLGGLLNRSEGLAGGRIGFKIQPKTKVFLAVHRGVVHYSAIPADRSRANNTFVRAANHKDWNADIGVEGQLSAKLKGRVAGGFHYGKYDADDLANNQRYVVREAQGSVSLAYKPTERDDINLSANRAVNEAVSGGLYFISTGLNLSAAHSMRKVTLGVNGGYQVDKYSQSITLPAVGGSSANRRDDTYTAGFKVDYKIQEWLMTGVSYQHKSRFSIFSDQFNYANNLTSWNVKVTF